MDPRPPDKSIKIIIVNPLIY